MQTIKEGFAAILTLAVSNGLTVIVADALLAEAQEPLVKTAL
ncbi:hypothetical protein HJ01_00503 [Flavobacterium frigoris PS1]|uniref:Uncharacterized protein n=1 Tax=Flavobacterium frigoris (strain PS1) TaxID=1086011 RepID=H7FN29_FLAFP|nr:hypothetical protein HJ01_00503 [Flavobacterium frigoris PS1]